MGAIHVINSLSQPRPLMNPKKPSTALARLQAVVSEIRRFVRSQSFSVCSVATTQAWSHLHSKCENFPHKGMHYINGACTLVSLLCLACAIADLGSLYRIFVNPKPTINPTLATNGHASHSATLQATSLQYLSHPDFRQLRILEATSQGGRHRSAATQSHLCDRFRPAHR